MGCVYKNPHSSGLENKKEGDGKSPAGLFKLGPVFSYHSLEKVKMPWQQVDSTDICVDDVKSAYYNRPLDKDSIAKQDWNSFEYMHRQDNAYEYGIWVLYNSTNYTRHGFLHFPACVGKRRAPDSWMHCHEQRQHH